MPSGSALSRTPITGRPDHRPGLHRTVAVSPSSSVQRARQELAERLGDIRLDSGLTARALSAAAGWHEAKTSRIESAKQAPSDADIRAWCQACEAESQAADLIAASRAADSMYMEWRRLNRTGLRRTQEARRSLYERTRLFRVYCSTVVPGFLQTPGYATALMSAITAFRGIPDDVADAVAARMNRNRILGHPGHRFAMLIEESVLRYQLGDTEVMAAQLGHILTAMASPPVSLGVIPFSASHRPMWTLEAFTAFDDTRVHVELLSAQVTVTVPSEVILYLRAFDSLAELAVYGPDARALITGAISTLG
jgi:transcriptional regulator with XRE-family HTH domain